MRRLPLSGRALVVAVVCSLSLGALLGGVAARTTTAPGTTNSSKAEAALAGSLARVDTTPGVVPPPAPLVDGVPVASDGAPGAPSDAAERRVDPSVRPVVAAPGRDEPRQPVALLQPVGGPVQAMPVLEPLAPGATPEENDLRAHTDAAQVGNIHGRVTDKDSREPLQGACATAYDQSYVEQATACTDATGAYAIDGIPAGSYAVYVRDRVDAHVTTAVAATVEVGRTTTTDFAMEKGGNVAGTVTDADTGAPLVGICVTIYGSGLSGYGGCTDAQGRYRTEGVTSGGHVVFFDATGPGAGPYQSAYRYPVDTTVGATTALDLTLVQGARFSGTVTDVDTHVPLAGICVQPVQQNGSALAQTCTNAAGRYDSVGLPAGTYVLRTRDATGHYLPSTSAAVTVAAREQKALDLTAQRGGTINGTVTDAVTGSPIVGLCPRDGGYSARGTCTDDHGDYQLYGLTGDATVYFPDPSGGHVPRWFRDAATRDDATVVPVTPGHDTVDIDQALAPGATITGTLRRALDGTPIAGECPSVVDPATFYRSSYDVPAVASACSDANGVYRISGLPASRYLVRFASYDNTIWAESWYDGKGRYEDATPIPLQTGQTATGIDGRLPKLATFSGVVASSDPKPLPGIRVSAIPSTCSACADSYEPAITAADGSFTTKGQRAGSYKLRFTDPTGRYGPTYAGGTTFDSATTYTVADDQAQAGVLVTMSAGAQVSGRLTRADDGKAAASVLVTATSTGGVELARTSSDSTGAYVLQGLPAGKVVVGFDGRSNDLLPEWWDDEPSAATATPVTTTAGQVTSGIDAVLAVGSSISGTVRDRYGNEVPGYRLTVDVVRPDGSADPQVPAERPPGGQYTLHGLPPGTYTLRFRVDGYRTVFHRSVEVQSAATPITTRAGDRVTGVDEVMSQGSTVSGRITDKGTGEPIGGACVTAASATGGSSYGGYACTGSDGRYRMTGLGPDTYRLLIDGPKETRYLSSTYKRADGSDTVTVGKDVDLTGYDSALAVGQVVQGTITDADNGDSVPQVCVRLAAMPCATSDGFGRYATNGVVPGTYTLTTQAPGFVDTTRQVTIGSSDLTLDLVLERAAILTGSVKGSDGAPLAYAYVSATRDGTGFAASTYTDQFGGFRLSTLPAGTHRVYVSNGRTHDAQWYDHKTAQQTATSVPLRQNESTSIDVVLQRRPQGTIAGRVTDARDGTPVSSLRVCLSSCTSTDADGRYSFTVVVGDYQVYAEGSAFLRSASQQVTVTDGSTATADFALQHGGQLGIAVTDADTGAALSRCARVYSTYYANPYEVGSTCERDGFSRALAPGTYILELPAGGGYVGEWYDHQRDAQHATVVTVTADQQTTVRTTQRRGGTASGRVTDQSGKPLTNVCVEAFAADRTSYGRVGCVGDDGRYATDPLPAGTTYLRFAPGYGTEHSPRFYDGATAIRGAKPVTIRQGEVTSGIDLVLQVAPASMSGQVLGSNGPLAGACVYVYEVSSTTATAGTCTQADGRWSLGDVPVGTYVLAMTDPSGLAATRWYSNPYGGSYAAYSAVADRRDAQRVTLVHGSVLTGLDAYLPPLTGFVAQVADEIGRPLEGVCGTAYADDDAPVAGSCSLPDGRVVISGLRGGSYRLGFSDPTGLHATAWYGGTSLATAAKQQLDEGRIARVEATLPGITTIRGTVRDALGGTLAGMCAHLYREDGSAAGVGSCSKADGTYALQGMPAGRYTVRVSDPAGGFASAGLGRVVAVASRQVVSGADVALPKLGSISGTIKNELGQAVTNGCAYLDRLDGTYAGLGGCVSNGPSFTIAGVPPGQYKLAFYGPVTRTPSPYWWKGASTEAAATVITVPDGGAVTGIDGVVPVVALP